MSTKVSFSALSQRTNWRTNKLTFGVNALSSPSCLDSTDWATNGQVYRKYLHHLSPGFSFLETVPNLQHNCTGNSIKLSGLKIDHKILSNEDKFVFSQMSYFSQINAAVTLLFVSTYSHLHQILYPILCEQDNWKAHGWILLQFGNANIMNKRRER